LRKPRNTSNERRLAERFVKAMKKSKLRAKRKPVEKCFNGKPMSYWEDAAAVYVTEVLVRAMTTGALQSIIHKLATKSLMSIAINLADPTILEEALDQRDVFRGDADELRRLLPASFKPRTRSRKRSLIAKSA
jgi:hypothetical protein